MSIRDYAEAMERYRAARAGWDALRAVESDPNGPSELVQQIHRARRAQAQSESQREVQLELDIREEGC